ncbi:hypothetical protein D051_0814 [Vibrio parahaemolyticus VPCR-2010]|uniref:hypothetical protein n=1 Tax=Vibrio parahaemolyticus TaxID=670 RepID=UPI00038E690C|nr:hypothetical protein D051_0814 [Vibrio parahaemolyticus VPCR-2010]
MLDNIDKKVLMIANQKPLPAWKWFFIMRVLTPKRYLDFACGDMFYHECEDRAFLDEQLLYQQVN